MLGRAYYKLGLLGPSVQITVGRVGNQVAFTVGAKQLGITLTPNLHGARYVRVLILLKAEVQGAVHNKLKGVQVKVVQQAVVGRSLRAAGFADRMKHLHGLRHERDSVAPHTNV